MHKLRKYTKSTVDSAQMDAENFKQTQSERITSLQLSFH